MINYIKNKDMAPIDQCTKELRADLKRALLKCKFSVRKACVTHSWGIDVYLMEAPFNPFSSECNEYYKQKGNYQVNHYYIDESKDLTEEAKRVLQIANELGNKHNWDESDAQVDYFNCHYFFSLAVGKWDKPFKQI